MSYLNPLRLHFAGKFQANVSTVNNDPAHFDNATFQSSYQNMEGTNMVPPNGWFNPQGDAAWRFFGCAVTSAWMPTGAVTAADPVLNYIIADSDRRAPAKLADLDSEQQLVSEIWGLQVRIAKADGTTLLIGDFAPAAFIDIWDRSTASAGGDTIAGAMYQSVLSNLQWGDVSSSAFLTALQQTASDGVLSIKFNVDSFNMDFTSPEFMTGRIVGTIGPATLSEPQHMVIGRQFMALGLPPAKVNFFGPVGGINFCAGVVDATANCMYLDLGNALSTGAGGVMNNVGDLTLSVYDPILSPPNPAGSMIPLHTIPATGTGGYASDANWYTNTAGIVVVPIDPLLMPLVQRSVLAISGNTNIVITESNGGAFVRADRYVYRLSPGDQVDIPVYATQWGQPLPLAQIGFVLDPSQLQPGSGFPYVAPSPPVATPTNALTFSATATTDNNGIALLSITAKDPGTPRYFNISASNPAGDYGIDGQVYGIRPSFTSSDLDTGPVNQWNYISFLLWSGFTPANPITWTDLQPIFQQYANLYPVMNRFLDLGNYDAVVSNANLLQLAFGLNPADPNAMPVTRDLSPAKRNAILSWLKNPLPAATPPIHAAGSSTAGSSTAGSSTTAPSTTAGAVESSAAAHSAAPKGGKAAAAARRLVLQSK